MQDLAVITNDLTLKVSELDATENTAAAGAASVQATNDATTGQQTVAVNVETGSASGDNTTDSTVQAESVSNFTFGYNISAGLEYRQDRQRCIWTRIWLHQLEIIPKYLCIWE